MLKWGLDSPWGRGQISGVEKSANKVAPTPFMSRTPPEVHFAYRTVPDTLVHGFDKVQKRSEEM